MSVATAQTEERIIDAARHCFSRFGVQKTVMEDIAREADLSRGTLYRYFQDKDRLFAVVSRRETQRFLDEVLDGTSRLKTLDAKIARMATGAIEYLSADSLNAAMIASDPEAFAAAISTGGRELLSLAIDTVKPMVEDAAASGEVRADLDAAQAAEWIVRMVLSLISTPSVTFDRDDPASVREFLHRYLLPGLT